MSSRFLRGVAALELEEQILNGGALLALVSVFLPWISGEWLGVEAETYSGFGFLTSFLGFFVFLINLALLLITLVPLSGGPVLLKKRYREITRVLLSAQGVILTLAALSVLTKVTFESSRIEVRFGIYFCLVGNLVVLLEAIIRFIEQRKSAGQELFHHPEDGTLTVPTKETLTPAPPPPPPPPPSAPEEHPLYPRA